MVSSVGKSQQLGHTKIIMLRQMLPKAISHSI